MGGHQPSILRANRSGGGVGTSPGINPIVPYTTAALDYRSSWISGEMVAMTKATTHNQKSKTLTETIQNEARGMRNSEVKPAKRRELPPPHRATRYLESSGLDRSLSTNIPDHPTAIQVNGLRMERVEGVAAPGYVEGVGSYDARVLCGNWNEERCDKAYKPSERKAATGRAWQWETTYEALSKSVADKVRRIRGPSNPDPNPNPSPIRIPNPSPIRIPNPSPICIPNPSPICIPNPSPSPNPNQVRPSRVSNAVTMYTDPASHYGTGKLEESGSARGVLTRTRTRTRTRTLTLTLTLTLALALGLALALAPTLALTP